jgi:hypothetical protein
LDLSSLEGYNQYMGADDSLVALPSDGLRLVISDFEALALIAGIAGLETVEYMRETIAVVE